jgi:F-type H+-transporting ATPase subunit gamma
MAGGQERILRRRIRSVQATKKITRAMELIAGSRIVRAQQRVHAAVPYSERITDVVRDLAQAGESAESPLLAPRSEIKKVCSIVIVADRGLCGAYNSNVLRAAEGEIRQDVLAGMGYSIIAVGRKAESYYRFRGYDLDAAYSGFSDNPTYADAREVANDAVGRFLSGEVDKVRLVYTRFVSVGFQEVVTRPLAPLEEELVEDVGESQRVQAGYEFEPSPGAILESLLPRYAEARVYAAMLNAAASEHAARQRAMKAATDNAEELIRNLTRVMNRARQDAITTEIMEIVGGAEALGQGARTEPELGSGPEPDFVRPPAHEHVG